MGELNEIEMKPERASKEPSKAPAPILPKVPRVETSQMAVGRAALVTAQNWFERGVTPSSWRVTADHCALHLQEAASLIHRSKTSSELAGQLDNTYRAMDAYILRTAPHLHGDEAEAFRHELKAIRSVADNLRLVLGMPKLPSKRSGNAASGSNDHYEADALDATLDLVLLETTTTLSKIKTSGEDHYVPEVVKTAASLRRNMNYAVDVLDAYGGADKTRRFGMKARAVGLALAQLQRFIDERQNRKQMLDAFAPVESKADELMHRLKLSAISKIEQTTTNDRDLAKDAGVEDIASARRALTSAFTTLQTNVSEGAFLFYALATKQDEPDEAALWTDMVKGLLIALVGNAMGLGVGRIAVKLGLMAAEGAAHGFTSNAATDAIQAWAGPMIDAAKGEAKSSADKNKAALYFKTSVVKAADGVRQRIEQGFDQRINERSVNGKEIQAAADSVANDAIGADTRTFHHASRDFALMLAQQSLGVDESSSKDPEAKRTTRIGKDYEFDGRGWTGGKQGQAEGIVRIGVTIGADGYSVDRYELVGLNKEMAKAVFEGAQGKIGRLGLPTEIMITTKQSGYPEMLVVDENQALRFSTSWNLLRQPPFPAARRFASAESAWKELRNAHIPNALVGDVR
jgi:hypothetical protein